MEKTYDHQKVEKKWSEFWEKSGLFKADPDSPKPPYGLLVPPPNLTGDLHLGHALEHSILDAIARFKRMQGYDVLLLPGVDHAGIQFEATFDKKLGKVGLSKQKLGREAWLKKAIIFPKFIPFLLCCLMIILFVHEVSIFALIPKRKIWVCL